MAISSAAAPSAVSSIFSAFTAAPLIPLRDMAATNSLWFSRNPRKTKLTQVQIPSVKFSPATTNNRPSPRVSAYPSTAAMASVSKNCSRKRTRISTQKRLGGQDAPLPRPIPAVVPRKPETERMETKTQKLKSKNLKLKTFPFQMIHPPASAGLSWQTRLCLREVDINLSLVSCFYRIELPSASTTCTVPRCSSRIPASTFARSPTTTHTNRSGLRKDFPAVVRSFVVSARTLDAYVEK